MKEKEFIPALVFISSLIHERMTQDALEHAKKARKTPELTREIKKLKAIDKRFYELCLEALSFNAATFPN
ncbi:MAG: hypothetical protein ACOC2M_00775 [bacterium]